jgi:hypothetical protein
LFPADPRILLQEFVERIPGFQVIEESLERDTRTAEDRFPAVDFRILHNDALSEMSHGNLSCALAALPHPSGRNALRARSLA